MISGLLLVAVVALAGLLVMTLMASNIYNVREAKKKREFAQHARARRYRRRPYVSVLVVAGHDETGLELTLQSLVKSSYRKLEIIIVANNSRPEIKRVAKKFIAEYPGRVIKLYARRVRSAQQIAVRKGYQIYGHGELVVLLQTGQTVNKQAFMRAVRHYNVEQDLGALIFNQRVDADWSLLGLLQKYEYLLRQRARKFSSLLKTEYVLPPNETLLCKKDAFLKHTKQKHYVPPPGTRTFFASDALVYMLPAPSLDALVRQRYELQVERLRAWLDQSQLMFSRTRYSWLLTRLRLPLATLTGAVAVFIPGLLGYFVYLAVSLRQPAFFVLSLAAFTIVLLLTIWDDEYLNLWEKVGFSAAIPVTYSLFCLFGLLLPIALVALAATRLQRYDWRVLRSLPADAGSSP